MIPKRFKLMGFDINVEWTDDLTESEDCQGIAEYRKNKIRLQKSDRPEQIKEQYFYHELVHWILYCMGEYDLQRNEKFVDLFAHLIYQALSTMVNEKESQNLIKIEDLIDRACSLGIPKDINDLSKFCNYIRSLYPGMV